MKIAAVVAVIVSIVLLAILLVASLLMRPGAHVTTPAPMPAASPEPSTPSAEPSGDPPWVVLEHDAEPLTAETLPGTDWHAGPYTLSFQDDGVVVVNRHIPGAWRLVGEAVIVEAQGQTLRGILSGASFTFEGREAERIAFSETPDMSPSRLPMR